MNTILIVDDTFESRELLKRNLMKWGCYRVITANSASEAFQILEGTSKFGKTTIDLILLDVVMPGMDGIEACIKIKSDERLTDIPIIMVTGMEQISVLEEAFKAGAMDFIKKPFNMLELNARIRSALKLKQEMDKRKARERELIEVTAELKEVNNILEQLSNIDGLTGVANRRAFDSYFEKEWKRAVRTKEPICIILLDIDKFKAFNDTYGHQEGDDCLKKVAHIFDSTMKRSSDLVARYGGEEFSAVLPDTNLEAAIQLAEQVRVNVVNEKIPNENSSVANYLTISAGVACAFPNEFYTPEQLLKMADQGLYYCKKNGRDQVASIQKIHEKLV